MSTVYVFMDEGGNFDFSDTGTRYFTLTCVARTRPFLLNAVLDDYKYDLLEYGQDREYFHCSEDNTHVRAQVFDRIIHHSDSLRVYSVVVDKSMTLVPFRDKQRFYPDMLIYLLSDVLRREMWPAVDEIIVVTDSIPLKRKRRAVEKAIKHTLASLLHGSVPHRILHHDSKAHYGLQIADYCNWAIYRKWEKDDSQYYDMIKPMIRSELELFGKGEGVK